MGRGSDSCVPLTNPLSHSITELGDLAVARQQRQHDEGEEEADEGEEEVEAVKEVRREKREREQPEQNLHAQRACLFGVVARDRFARRRP